MISKEVSSHCLPVVEFLITCRPHYLPREFSSIFFVAVYIPPQTDAGTNAELNELYSAISKQENMTWVSQTNIVRRLIKEPP